MHTDNGIEFWNKNVDNFLENREIKYVLEAPYHPQSQGVIETFNKYIQNWLYKAFNNISKSNEEEKKQSLKEKWNLNLTINSFLNYYNWIRKQITTEYIPRWYSLNMIMKKSLKMWS